MPRSAHESGNGHSGDTGPESQTGAESHTGPESRTGYEEQTGYEERAGHEADQSAPEAESSDGTETRAADRLEEPFRDRTQSASAVPSPVLDEPDEDVDPDSADRLGVGHPISADSPDAENSESRLGSSCCRDHRSVRAGTCKRADCD